MTQAVPTEIVRNGLEASVIRALQAKPLYGVSGFALAKGMIDITGLALPPVGQPNGVSVETAPGVAHEFEFGLASPGAQDAYWYWPNSAHSAFRLRINLAETRHAGPAYPFRLNFAGHSEDNFERIRTSFFMPKDLGCMENYPALDSLSRVQRYDTISGVALRGYSDAVRILTIAELYGFSRKTGKVLDWGTGHGRVIRHFRSIDVGGPLFGLDIDPLNIQWAQTHLSDVDFSVGPLMPPTQYNSDTFDLIYGISVMTHLTRTVQEAWLEEIRRILAPGGLALLTFAGSSAVAFASRYLTPAWIAEFQATGTGPDLPDNSLENVIDQPDYYKNVKLGIDKASELASRYLTVLGTHLCMFGYQDLLVLQHPGTRLVGSDIAGYRQQLPRSKPSW
jgi:SAM-dependent methyltransferase